jgi:dTDP-4-dehydrorhamnose 3,5-epimerase
MQEAGINTVFVQDNQASSTKGVLRGLHFQKEHAQTKLLRVIKGSVFDVAVDLRPGSATFGKWYGEILSDENYKQLLIPRGFAHGYLVLSDTAEICYKCDDFYHPGDEGGLAWNDPEIGIEWPELEGTYKGNSKAEGYTVGGSPLILNARDENWPGVSSFRK